MALTKEVFIDSIEVLTESGNLQIREATVIKEDGVEISRTFHRKVMTALDNHSSEDKLVRDISAIVHTPELKAKEQARLDKEQVVRDAEKKASL